jgi:hypothetical protein
MIASSSKRKTQTYIHSFPRLAGLLLGGSKQATPYVRGRRLTTPASSSWGALGLMWRGWGSVRVMSCYIFTAGDVLLGLLLLLAAPWAAYRTGALGGLLSGRDVAVPFTRLLIVLGLGCGTAGYFAVGKLGGDRQLWLVVWEAWVALQVAFAVVAHRIFRISARAREGGGAAALAAADDMYERSFGWLYAVMWALVGVALPVAAGWLPFACEQGLASCPFVFGSMWL